MDTTHRTAGTSPVERQMLHEMADFAVMWLQVIPEDSPWATALRRVHAAATRALARTGPVMRLCPPSSER